MTRILVVDDDSAIADVAGSGLATYGFDVIRAADGAEGLVQFERYHPDIVITDMVMPEMQGWSLIGNLRQRSPSVKIIAMTGGGLDTPRTYLKLAQQVGANVTLQKPFTIAQLLQAIAQLDQPPSPPQPIIPAGQPRLRRKPKAAGD
jgi:CheY-like chemotaxis protein